MERYICIHGHFYQPPRENPWLECIEFQDSAYPYHDWNERVCDECYAPNTASRILDGQGRITQIINNYARVSFNFGPTLLSWMEQGAPDAYQPLLEADQESGRRFSGHGSALAQAYNHMIMPLANGRDRYTQVLWGLKDFEHRFGRQAEGMWLPEMAVDVETLEVLARLGVRFTILSPHQALKVRPLGGREWQDVLGGKIDPTRAYLLRLPSGRSIALFFREASISRAIAFENLLSSGEQFSQRLLGAFSAQRAGPQLVHIATDGETYGHHHKFGDMALAYALHHIESNGMAQLTNYGEYLEKHPPTEEVEIAENTSWSCVHGIERWRSDCGCRPGTHSGWNQAWRTPLREALDWLRDTLAPKYQERAGSLLKDAWAARDDYIQVILDRSAENIERFLNRHAVRELTEVEKVTALKLLELQRHAMLMFTSCAWFFDDLSGIETVQILQYAGRVVQLAQDVLGEAVEEPFLKLLGEAKSNILEHGDGRNIYRKWVKPAVVNLTRAAAHYAISALFEDYGGQEKVCCYQINREDYLRTEVGKARLAVGRVMVTSDITKESAVLEFGVFHLGDHNLSAGIREFQRQKAYHDMADEVLPAFSTADFPEVIRLLDKHFGLSSYSLHTLFKDEQRRVINSIMEDTMAELEAAYRQYYERYHPLLGFLGRLGNPLPKALLPALGFLFNTDLTRALSSYTFNLGRVRELLEEAKAWNIELDTRGLGYLLAQTLEEKMSRFLSNAEDLARLQVVAEAAALARSLPFDVDLWRVQNLYYKALQAIYPEYQGKAGQGDRAAQEWVEQFVALGELLSMRVV